MIIVALILSCQQALADFSFQSYRNRNSPHFTFLDSAREESSVADNPLLNSVTYHYFRNPLGYDQKEDGRGTMVPGIHSFNMAGEYSPKLNTSLGLELPIYQLNYRQQGDTFAVGDLRAFSKLRLSTGLAVIPSVYLPTGNSSVMLSNPNGGAGLALAAEHRFAAALWNMNAGVEYFSGASLPGADYALQPYGGAGVNYTFSNRWGLQIEGLGRVMNSSLLGDFYVGGRMKAGPDRLLTFGGSLASNEFDGAAMYRLMLGWMWNPGRTKVITEKVRTKIETIQKFKTVLDCGPKPYLAQIRARPLTEKEKQSFLARKSLPYLSASSRAIQLLSPGVKMDLAEGNLSVVRDGIVLFAFDLSDLPVQASVITVKDLELLITVNKLWRAPDDKTGMICLLEEKICSGDLNQKNLSANINPSFFGGKEPPNDYFIRQIFHTAPPSGKSVTKAKLTLPLEKLIENSTFTNTLELIYPPTKTLYLGVAGDIYVSREVKLSVNMSVQVCTADKAKPTIETFEEKSKVLEEGPDHE